MAGLSSGSCNEPTCESLKADANAQYTSRNYDLAVELYTRALELSDSRAMTAALLSNRSAAHYNAKRYQAALEDAEACLAEDSMFIKGYSRKALALLALGRPGDAELCYRQGLKVDPKSAVMREALEKATEDDPKLKPVRRQDSSDRHMRILLERVGESLFPHTVESFGHPAFMSAYVGHLGELKRTLVREDLTRRVSELQLPITIMCVAGAQRVTGPCEHAAVLRYLITQGCRVNARDIAGMTALMHAVTQVPLLELVEILLVEGHADPNLQDCFGASALHYAAVTDGALPCLKLLIKHGANLEAKDNDGRMPADYGGNLPDVAATLAKAVDRKRETPVFAAVPHGCAQCGAQGAKLSCSQCRAVRYCNRDCQKKHWKVHRKLCQPPQDVLTVPLWPEGPDVPPMATAIDRRKFNRELMDMITGAKDTPPSIDSLKICEPMTAETNAQAAKAVHTIVKIQVPISHGLQMLPAELPPGEVLWLMCYDKERKLQTMIDPRTSAGARLVEIIERDGVRATGTPKGCKGYFKAFVSESNLGQLNIISKMHPPQPW